MRLRERWRATRKLLWFVWRHKRLAWQLFRDRRMPAAALFRDAWRQIESEGVDGWKLGVDAKFYNSKRRLVHYEFRHLFKRLFPQYRPETRLTDSGALALLRSGPAVVVTVHSRSEYATAATLDRAGQPCAIVTRVTVNEQLLDTYGFRTRPRSIKAGRRVLLEARAALQDGCAILFVADYDRRHERARKVSLQVLDFARLVRARLFFAHTQIDGDGVIECFLEAAPARDSVADNAGDLIAFVDRIEGSPTGMRPGDWAADRATRRGY